MKLINGEILTTLLCMLHNLVSDYAKKALYIFTIYFIFITPNSPSLNQK